MDKAYSKYFVYIKPVFKSKGVQTYSPIIFSIIAITIFALFAVRPTVSTIVGLQKTIQERQDLLHRLEQKTKDLNEGRSNLEKLGEDQKNKIYTLIPNSTSIPCLIDNLNYMATSNQVTVTGLQFQPLILEGKSKCIFTDLDLTSIDKKATVKEIEFTLNSQGTYPDLIKFLNSLNQVSRLVSIKTVSLTKQASGPLVMSISGKAYYFTSQVALEPKKP
jgi:Tfp pilus assembly protein PilO